MYTSNVQCIWLISIASGHQIRITFDSFDLEEDINCALDYLILRDGTNVDSPIIGRFCGSSAFIPQQYYYSSGKYLWIEFRSDDAVSKGGFHLSWDTIVPETTKSTSITTPSVLGKHRVMTGRGILCFSPRIQKYIYHYIKTAFRLVSSEQYGLQQD